MHATDRPHYGNLAVVLPTPRPRGNLFPSLQHRGPSVHATGRPHHVGGMHCSSWLSEVRPAGPPRLCVDAAADVEAGALVYRVPVLVRTVLAPAADACAPHVGTSVYGRGVEIKVPSPQQAALAGLLT